MGGVPLKLPHKTPLKLRVVEESDKSIDEIIELIRQAGSSADDDDIES